MGGVVPVSLAHVQGRSTGPTAGGARPCCPTPCRPRLLHPATHVFAYTRRRCTPPRCRGSGAWSACRTSRTSASRWGGGAGRGGAYVLGLHVGPCHAISVGKGLRAFRRQAALARLTPPPPHTPPLPPPPTHTPGRHRRDGGPAWPDAGGPGGGRGLLQGVWGQHDRHGESAPGTTHHSSPPPPRPCCCRAHAGGAARPLAPGCVRGGLAALGSPSNRPPPTAIKSTLPPNPRAPTLPSRAPPWRRCGPPCTARLTKSHTWWGFAVVGVDKAGLGVGCMVCWGESGALGLAVGPCLWLADLKVPRPSPPPPQVPGELPAV